MSFVDELERLRQLHARGGLTDREYQQAKAKLLSGRSSFSVLDDLTRIQRSRTDSLLAGVCGGLALSTGVHSAVWRLLAVTLTFIYGSGFLVYALLAVLIPLEDESHHV